LCARITPTLTWRNVQITAFERRVHSLQCAECVRTSVDGLIWTDHEPPPGWRDDAQRRFVQRWWCRSLEAMQEFPRREHGPAATRGMRGDRVQQQRQELPDRAIATQQCFRCLTSTARVLVMLTGFAAIFTW
jgi:hypothetical protein